MFLAENSRSPRGCDSFLCPGNASVLRGAAEGKAVPLPHPDVTVLSQPEEEGL